MASLLIVINKNGESKQYRFHQLGPITFGSQESCDIALDRIKGKLFEVWLSSGETIIRKSPSSVRVCVDGKDIGDKDEVPVKSHETISIGEGSYKIKVLTEGLQVTPPPFYSDQYQKELIELREQIKEKEELLAQTERMVEKKKIAIDQYESQIKLKMVERSKKQHDIDLLNQKIEILQAELEKKNYHLRDKEQELASLQKGLENVRNENHQLNLMVQANETNLLRIKIDIEKHHNLIEQQKEQLVALQIEESQRRNQLMEIEKEKDLYTNLCQKEKNKIQKALKEINDLNIEKNQISTQNEDYKRQKDNLEQELYHLNIRLEDVERTKKETLVRLQEVQQQIDQQEQVLLRTQKNITHQQENERQLVHSIETLKLEISKTEDLIQNKKHISHQLDLESQALQKEIRNAKRELDSILLRIKECSMEERSQQFKMDGLRREHQLYLQKLEQEKQLALTSFENEKEQGMEEIQKLSMQANELKSQLEQLKQKLHSTESQHQHLSRENKILLDQRKDIIEQIEKSKHHLDQLNQQTNFNINENNELAQQKKEIQSELTILKHKLMECEGQIKSKMDNAQQEIEQLKRLELSKIEGERNKMLLEFHQVQLKAQKDLEKKYQEEQNHLQALTVQQSIEAQKLMERARSESALIVDRAIEVEKNLTQDATSRLQAAQRTLQQSQQQAQLLLQETETKVHNEYELRKNRFQEYYHKKKAKTDKHLNQIIVLEKERLLRLEKKQLARIEDFKRKEFKKVMKIKSEALSDTQNEKSKLTEDIRKERLRALEEIHQLRNKQEQELSESRKSFLEQLSHAKVKQQQMLENELHSMKIEFERSKTLKRDVTTRAINDLLVSELGHSVNLPADFSNKIKAAVELGLNGPTTEARIDIAPVIDLEPTRKKNILPVLQKYTLHYAIPGLVALVFLFDIGSSRTATKDFFVGLLKQQNSATEIYVNNQREEWKQKYTFNPVTTPDYKDSYTNNILYTTDFFQKIENEDFQNKWILSVNNFIVDQLEMSEDIAISFISSEGTLVKEMSQLRSEINPQFLDQSILRLKELENKHLGWFPEKFSDKEKLNQFYSFRKSFYENYKPATRSLATQEEPNL